jgi:hypothetical protein
MNKLLAVVAALLLLFSGCGPAAQPEPVEFSSAAGRFTVRMPGKPAQASKVMPLSGGASTTLYQFTLGLEGDTIAYYVSYNDYAIAAKSDTPALALAVLTAARDSVVEGKTMTADTAITLDGAVGRAFRAQGADGSVIDGRVYWTGKRMYQVIVLSEKGHRAEGREAFMDSFHIKPG